ncbi:MAG: hypothetical protein JWM36_4311 [Hyphomicrobiales bacterium]|nr:hypothetical protein [Hyphomicrobiales bacterium]
MDPHLALTEQTPRKDGDTRNWQAPRAGHEEGRHGEFRHVELAHHHSLVAIGPVAEFHTLADLQNLQFDTFGHRNGSIEKREVTVIAIHRDRDR